MTFGSLFAGIGGFDLGLERAGMECRWQVEIDAYASSVLAKHWPGVTRWGDVRTFPVGDPADWHVDLICAGVPCQPVSNAGKQKGASDERWMWGEALRVIADLCPRFFVAENPIGLLNHDGGRTFHGILRALASVGYVCQWHVVPACAVGAPHRRERVWLIAYADSTGIGLEKHRSGGQGRESSVASQPAILRQEHGATCAEGAFAGRADVANSNCLSCLEGQPRRACGGLSTESAGSQGREDQGQARAVAGDCCADVADAYGMPGPQQQCDERRRERQGDALSRSLVAVRSEADGWWSSEPAVGRVAHGIPNRVDRLRCLGNAVVPQVAEVIGRAIIAMETEVQA